jgi:cation diffusion facilitator CzcD-associated flavoprotein CzcO
MTNRNHFEPIIIGGAQAGLSVSYRLKAGNQDHISLEQASQAANS